MRTYFAGIIKPEQKNLTAILQHDDLYLEINNIEFPLLVKTSFKITFKNNKTF